MLSTIFNVLPFLVTKILMFDYVYLESKSCFLI